jgi:hypothetical protein
VLTVRQIPSMVSGRRISSALIGTVEGVGSAERKLLALWSMASKLRSTTLEHDWLRPDRSSPTAMLAVLFVMLSFTLFLLSVSLRALP